MGKGGSQGGGAVVAVSVIVPVYNVERYLEQCLDSVVAQTWTDIEVICVDDGSTDGSLAILQRYAQADSRVRVVSQANHGYGYAMNRGLDLAGGEFVGIVESDDWIEPTMYADLVALARNKQADIAKGDFWLNWTNGRNRQEPFGFFEADEDGAVVCPRDYRDAAIFRKKPSVWSAIYRRSFLDRHGIRFLETGGAAFQDTSFSFKVLALAERMVCSTTAYVHYRQDNAGSSINAGGSAFGVCDEYAEIERFLDQSPRINAVLGPVIAPLMYNTFIWNYDRLAPDLKLPFLEVASPIFRRLLAQGKVEWDRFHGGRRRRTNFRVIADDPGLYHKWRSEASQWSAGRRLVSRALGAIKGYLRTVSPSSWVGLESKV